jgi:Na+/melibiose symporter-like transporter
MGSRRLLEEVYDPSSGVYYKNRRKIASFRRWLLWIPLAVFASLLYILDIGGEFRYHMPLPNNIAFGE